MNFKCNPLYLKYPIFQIIYILLWIPLGYYLSYLIASDVVYFSFLKMIEIASIFLPVDIQLFILSHRMDVLVEPFYLIVTIAYDLILLVVGLELICYLLNKKKNKGDRNENLPE